MFSKYANKKNLNEQFMYYIQKYPEKTFAIQPVFEDGILVSENKITYKDLLITAKKVEAEIGNGYYQSRIGIIIDNSIEFVLAFISAILNGFIVVAINPDSSDDEVHKIIKDNNIGIFFTIKSAMSLINNADVKLCKIFYFDEDNLHYKEDESIINFKFSTPQNEDLALVSYTSGTSGTFSKGVELTYLNISSTASCYQNIYKLNQDSKIIVALPMWHNYGMFACVTSAMFSNSTIIIMKRWNLKEFVEINIKYRPQVFPGSPYMYLDIVGDDNNIDLASLETCDSGGDILTREMINRFEEKTNANIIEGYGLTETTSLTHFNMSIKERKIGSIGLPINEAECKITDRNGNEVPENTWGILWVKGPMVFKGYVNNLDLTQKVLCNDWFNTNDIVKKDNDGYYYIAGRLSDLSSLDKMKISIKDLENEIYKCRYVKRVFIENKWNKAVGLNYYNLYIILTNDNASNEVYDFIKVNIKNIVINSIKIVKKLPTTSTGKVKRNRLEES